MRRWALTALLCALLCCAAPAHASETPAAQVPYVLELRGLGIAVSLNEDWQALVAEGRLHFLLDYTLQPQEQTMETVALDIFFWPDPPATRGEIAMEEWEAAGAVRIASIRGSRRESTQACATKQARPVADENAAEEPDGPEQIALPDGGAYAYTLVCYPAPFMADPALEETVEKLLDGLRTPKAVIRTFAPEPLR
ncbi:MAG TPA: hypothetical protein PKE04_02910 [Clostridia bacterium]|nr:hypothetical protein [Clostridia bacterium]